MKRVDLNVDIGEGFPFDVELLRFATSANICCGVHAGSWDLTRETIGNALDAGVRIGMHPGYPDRVSMGRAALPQAQADEFRASIEAQVERFYNFVPAAYLKPHGALYNESADIGHPAWSIVNEVCERWQLPLLGLPGTAHAGGPAGFFAEGFVDRRYTREGTLLPRSEPGALLTDLGEISRQAVTLAPHVDSLCLHGDTPGCVEILMAVHGELLRAGFEVGP